jgi:N-succinyldiaminopimelate aminotransferase
MRGWTAKRLDSCVESVFDETHALAQRFGAVDLGSGTPTLPVPPAIQTAVTEAIATGRNQYAPVRGEGVLRTAVAAHAARFYGQVVDPASEVSITCGVTEAVHAVLMSVVNPGDEVIVFEPFYDCYVPALRFAGGTPVAVTLHAPAFQFDPQELRAAFSPRTKAILVNTPHNPTGTVFSRSQLNLIAQLCREFDALAITDEVYEHIVYDGAEHVRLATLPGMAERTLTISGAGKTLSCTGWRIGWVIGPAAFHDALCRLRQFTVFTAPTPLQLGIAAGLRLPEAYFRQLTQVYQAKRDFLMNALARGGLKPKKPAGSFFILTELSELPFADGRAFCRELARHAGVAPISLDSFYLNQQLGERIARFTFCVHEELLDEAAKRLAKASARLRIVSGKGIPC